MSKLFTLCISFLLFVGTTFGQGTATDTANYPYWIDMMADPNINFYKTQRAFDLYWENRNIDKGSGFKPFMRWAYDTKEIMDGKGNIPAPGVLEAEVEKYIAMYRSMFPGGSSPGALGGANCLTNGNWLELGPVKMPSNKTGQPNGLGRINALAFHPTDTNLIYAGAPAGGLWISRNGGKSWSTTTDTLATLGISAIVLDPQRPDTIYIGTGDRDASDAYGRGVWKSTNGGQDWVSMSSGMGNVTVSRLIMDPNNSQILLAATNGGIYRTTNGGNTWTRVMTGNFKDIVFDVADSRFVFGVSSANANFYRSTNNGVAWTQITSGLPTGKRRMAVAVTPHDSNYVYVVSTNNSTYDGLYLSKDRGLNFTLMSDTPNIMDYSHLGTGTGGQAWYDLDIAVDPKVKHTVYVCGVNIFKSNDEGKTWKINAHWVGSGGAPNVHADNHVLEFQPITNALFTGNDGGVYYTKNKGKTWPEISDGLAVAQIYRLGQSAKTADLLINGYQDNGTGIMVGSDWFTIMGGDGMDCLIDPTDDAWAYSDLYYGDIRRYKNNIYNGNIGKSGSNGITESGGWVTPFILREGNANTMFAGYKNVWRTTNVKTAVASSVTWTKISDNLGGANSNNITVLENSSVDNNLLYVAREDNKLFKSSNAGAATPTWTDLTSNLPNSAQIQWIESHSRFKERVWICQSNKIYQSNNGGTSWTNISNGLPDIPILCATFDSSSKYQGIYIGTYMGVFYKDTTMSNWTWYNDKMPVNTRVRDIEIYYSPNGRSKSHVVCATYGRGNWRSPLYDEERKMPIAGFKIDVNRICQNQTVSFIDTSANIPTQWEWKITPRTYTFLNGTDSNSQNPVIRFNQKGSYQVQLSVANCAGIDSIIRKNYIEVYDQVAASVCNGFTRNIGTYGIGIFGVNISDFTHKSLGPDKEGAYLDRACTDILYLKTDTAYLATITTGVSYDEYVKIFIDYNNDGDLNDAGEMVYSPKKGRTTHKDSIRIPIKPTTNQLLRMRIKSDFDSIRTNACDTLRYGQTEDFGVVILPRIPTPHLYADTNSICQNSAIVLRDSSHGSIYNKRWYLRNYISKIYAAKGDGPISFSPSDTGWYYAELVLNDSLVSQRIDSIVFVKPMPKAGISIISGKLNSCEGDGVKLENGAGINTNLKHSWFKNGTIVSTQKSNQLLFSTLVLADSGNYHSSVELNGCVANTNPLKIVVSPTPSALFTSNKTNDCFINNSFDFSNNTSVVSGTLAYVWDFGQGSKSSNKNTSFSYADTGNYVVKLKASTNKGCSDSTTQTVQVYSSPTIGFTINSSQQCLKNNDFVFTNSSSIDVGSLTYSWDFGDGTKSVNENSRRSYVVAGKYAVQLIAISNQNCADTLIQNITVNPSPIADFQTNIHNQCGTNNQFDFIDASSITVGNIASHEWLFESGNTSISKDVVAKNFVGFGNFVIQKISISDLGCSDTAVKSVTVNQKPKVTTNVNNSNQCFNNHNFALGFTTTDVIINTQWNFGDGNSLLSSNPTNKTYATSGKFTISLVVENAQRCIDTFLIPVEINPNPIADFDDVKGCVGDQISFINKSTISTGTILSGEWNFGDGKTSSGFNPNHVYSDSGKYAIKLVVTSDLGCKDSIIKVGAAEIFAKPEAIFSYQKISMNGTSTEVLFNDNSINTNSRLWFFPNNESSISPSPVVTFADSGTYTIALFVTNSNGCVDTSIQSIFIFPDNTFHLPNSFTPNNDGLNDMLLPFGLGIVFDYEMVVYNRWGMLLFKTNNHKEGWDGKYQDQLVESGAYLVTIKFNDLARNKSHYQSTVQVLK